MDPELHQNHPLLTTPEFADRPKSLEDELSEQLAILKLKVVEVRLQIKLISDELAKGRIPDSLMQQLQALNNDYFQLIDTVSNNASIQDQVRTAFKTRNLDAPLEYFFAKNNINAAEQSNIEMLADSYMESSYDDLHPRRSPREE